MVCQGSFHFIPQWDTSYFCTKTTSCLSYPVWLCLSHSGKQKPGQQDEWSRKRSWPERVLLLNYTLLGPIALVLSLQSSLTVAGSPHGPFPGTDLSTSSPLTQLSLLAQLWASSLAPSPRTTPYSVSDSATLESTSKIRVTRYQSISLLSWQEQMILYPDTPERVKTAKTTHMLGPGWGWGWEPGTLEPGPLPRWTRGITNRHPPHKWRAACWWVTAHLHFLFFFFPLKNYLLPVSTLS